MKGKSGRIKVLGTFVCICGVLVLILYKGMALINPQTANKSTMGPSTNKSEKWVTGSILVASSCILWSSWFLIQARISKRYPCQYSSTAILSLFGATQSAVLTLVVERNYATWILRGKLEIMSVIYSGAVGSGLCYVAMSWCVKQRGPVFTAAFTPLIQIFVAMLDFCILHEAIYLGSVAGSVLVIIGMYILLWGKSKEGGELSATKGMQVNQVQIDEEWQCNVYQCQSE